MKAVICPEWFNAVLCVLACQTLLYVPMSAEPLPPQSRPAVFLSHSPDLYNKGAVRIPISLESWLVGYIMVHTICYLMDA